MTRRQKGVVLAVAHVLIVSSLGAKLMADRARLPRVWARTAPVDPDALIRGGYVRLRIDVEGTTDLIGHPIALRAHDGRLTAVSSPRWNGLSVRQRTGQPDGILELEPPLAFFIPEHVADPSRRVLGEELWVEVTVPARGAPRPIRLAVKKDGSFTPLELR